MEKSPSKENLIPIVSRKEKSRIIWFLALPIIIVIFLVVLLSKNPIDIIKQIWNYRHTGLSVIPTDFPTFSEVIYYIICSYTVIVSGIFSFLLYKATTKSIDISKKNVEILENSILVSERSNVISEENKQLQVKTLELTQDNIELMQGMAKRDLIREKEKDRENTLIVYYDILMGLNDLEKLKLCLVNSSTDLKPKRLFFSSEWIKNVASLKALLPNEEIKMIYQLYGDLLTIKDYLENKIIKERNIGYTEYRPEKRYDYDSDIFSCIKDLFNEIIEKDIWIVDRPDRNNHESIIKYLRTPYSSILFKLKDEVDRSLVIESNS